MKWRPGLFRRRECVVPTLRGWFVMLLLCLALAVGFVRNIYSFLAVNDPKPGGVLVVEGWASEDVMLKVVAEFQRGHYDGIYCTGGPIDSSSPLAQYHTFAEYGAMLLGKLGCDPKMVHVVSSPLAVRDRTYSSAVALKRWLAEQGNTSPTVNLFSMGAHSRRSRLLFEKAFGDGAQIGIVVGENPDFDPRRWWTTSAGFRHVTDEVIAYLYARFLFRPAPE